MNEIVTEFWYKDRGKYIATGITGSRLIYILAYLPRIDGLYLVSSKYDFLAESTVLTQKTLSNIENFIGIQKLI